MRAPLVNARHYAQRLDKQDLNTNYSLSICRHIHKNINLTGWEYTRSWWQSDDWKTFLWQSMGACTKYHLYI